MTVYFLKILVSGEFKMKVPADSGPGEGPLLAVPSHGEKGKKALGGYFYEDASPILENSTLVT